MFWLVVVCGLVFASEPEIPEPTSPPEVGGSVEQAQQLNKNLAEALARLEALKAENPPPPPTEPPTGTVAIVTVDEAPAPAEPPEAAKPTE